MRKYGKLDANQRQIMEELRQLGCSVKSVADLGDGCGDILCGHRGRNYLFEIKDPDKPPSKCKLTAREVKFQSLWTGQIDTIETTQDAARIMGLVVDPRLGFTGVGHRP